MEDIGGIIFYIIAAVIGIVTTVGKKKRKAARTSQVPEADEDYTEPVIEVEDSGDVFQRIPEEYLGEDFWAEETIEASPEVKDMVDITDFNPDNIVGDRYEEPIVEEFRNEEKSPITIEKDLPVKGDKMKDGVIKDKEIGETDKILSEFDLKEAIIYSEILNRKYY